MDALSVQVVQPMAVLRTKESTSINEKLYTGLILRHLCWDLSQPNQGLRLAFLGTFIQHP